MSLDMMTVFKASQAISKEFELDRLLETLMRVVIEAAGAQQGVLLLQQDDELVVRAFSQTGKENIQLEEIPFKEFHNLPLTVINYVRHTNEIVVVGDAQREPLFANELTSNPHLHALFYACPSSSNQRWSACSISKTT